MRHRSAIKDEIQQLCENITDDITKWELDRRNVSEIMDSSLVRSSRSLHEFFSLTVNSHRPGRDPIVPSELDVNKNYIITVVGSASERRVVVTEIPLLSKFPNSYHNSLKKIKILLTTLWELYDTTNSDVYAIDRIALEVKQLTAYNEQLITELEHQPHWWQMSYYVASGKELDEFIGIDNLSTAIHRLLDNPIILCDDTEPSNYSIVFDKRSTPGFSQNDVTHVMIDTMEYYQPTPLLGTTAYRTKCFNDLKIFKVLHTGESVVHLVDRHFLVSHRVDRESDTVEEDEKISFVSNT